MKNRVLEYFSLISQKENKGVTDQMILNIPITYRKFTNFFSSNNNNIISRLYLRNKYYSRQISGKKYNFVTVDELIIWTNDWIKTFPTTYDLIIGTPRSGLLVANIIALKLGKPLTTPELYSQGKFWISKRIDKNKDIANILLVDDSITSGTAMEESFKYLQLSSENVNVTKAALIVTEESKSLVDLYYRTIPHPRLFEWNMMHAKKGKLAVDMDGVLCENCPPSVDSDEKSYINWMKYAKPYLIPSFEIDAIVSNRLEKYRPETEEWLKRHNIQYKELILWDIESKKERNGKHAQRKTEVLLKIKPEMYWESSLHEAKEIWKNTKIPTVCIDEMCLFE